MFTAVREELEELYRSHGPTWWDLPEAQLAHEDQLSEMVEALQVAKEVEGYLGDPNVLPFVFDPRGLLTGAADHLGRLTQPTKSKKEADARLGSGLVDRLPSFDQFDCLDIVAIRESLNPYLVPFRSFVVETSSALASVV